MARLKKDLEKDLDAANSLISTMREELRIAEAANGTTNKALQDEQTETRRLRKVLDHAITATDSRLAVVRPMYALIHHDDRAYRDNGPSCCQKEKDRSTTEAVAQLPDENKFLEHLRAEILSGQYKPEEDTRRSSIFGHGFGY